MKKFILLAIVLLAAGAAYTQFQTPKETALETALNYYRLAASGRSFEEDAAFYTQARQAEIQARIDGADNPDAMKEAYLKLTQTQAACSELTLAGEAQNGDVTRLVFDVNDTCGTYGDATVQEIIELVDEGGSWKILSNETSISD